MVDQIRQYDKAKANQEKGRSTIDNPKRERSYSKRAANGKISVERKTCPYCQHSKAFSNINTSGYKCARCKRRYK